MIKKYPYIKKCIHCSSNFVIKSAHYKTKKYCKFECSVVSKTKHHRETNCIECRTELNRHQRRFCSRSCSAVYNNRLILKTKKKIIVSTSSKKPPTIPKLTSCMICNGSTNSYTRKYCSDSCRLEGRKIKQTQPRIYNLTCKHCSIPFTNTRQVKYCESCSHLYSHNGRARYWFSINVFKYPNLFDLDSLKKVGFRSKDNPNGYTRDHKVSVNEAIRNNYDPYYITHVMNCELMLWEENNKKKTKSSILYDDLVKLVDEHDRIVGRGG